MTPQRIRCKKCDSTLYEGEELKPPQEIIRRYWGRCPGCGNKLSSLPKEVEIKPITHAT